MFTIENVNDRPIRQLRSLDHRVFYSTNERAYGWFGAGLGKTAEPSDVSFWMDSYAFCRQLDDVWNGNNQTDNTVNRHFRVDFNLAYFNSNMLRNCSLYKEMELSGIYNKGYGRVRYGIKIGNIKKTTCCTGLCCQGKHDILPKNKTFYQIGMDILHFHTNSINNQRNYLSFDFVGLTGIVFSFGMLLLLLIKWPLLIAERLLFLVATSATFISLSWSLPFLESSFIKFYPFNIGFGIFPILKREKEAGNAFLVYSPLGQGMTLATPF